MREIWHYQKANLDNIKKVRDQFQWPMRFTNIDVNGKVINKTIKNIILNYNPHKRLIVMIPLLIQGFHLG